MENIKKIYIKENGTPIYTHYNGSWNVMKMETTDGLDYSYSISEMIDDNLYEYEEENGELTGDDYDKYVATELEYLAECCGWELVRADWFLEKESQLNYLQAEMMNTNCVCDYIFNGAEKPHFTNIWKEVSEGNNSYTMEDIHKIIYGYNNPEEFKFIMSLDDRFYDKVEKMKVVVESEDDETLVFGESSEKLFNIIYG
jgi:hypothetical protein